MEKEIKLIIILTSAAQKEYKTWYDWMGTVIQGELCKKLKFDRSNK